MILQLYDNDMTTDSSTLKIYIGGSLLYISLLYRCYIAALTTNYFNKNFPQEDGVFQNKKNHKRKEEPLFVVI